MKKLCRSSFSVLAGLCYLTFQNTQAFADTHPEVDSTPLVGLYMSVYGGGGAMMSGVSLTQLATALYDTEAGGPIAVNAKGSSKSSGFWLVGANIGYNWFTKPLAQTGFRISPSIELEGFYIGQHTIIGPYQNNKHTRLGKHIFEINLPINIGAALVNMVFDFNHRNCPKLHGYLGLGWGAAVTSISQATAYQTTPPEHGINHFSGDPNDTGLAFAAQPKIGLLFDCSSRVSLFGEYRFLYLSNTDYQFGSTIADGHVATTDWIVKIGPQLLNIGILGIRVKL
ncbi:MAG: hypothetical protein FJZ58_05085 [Chlamydiae bacterium]|nr:hypothetical protein [Chlamydiota bacterium]